MRSSSSPALFGTLLAATAAVTSGLKFESREAFVSHINSHAGIKWTAAVQDKFRSQSIGAAKSLCGLKPDFEAKYKAALDARIKMIGKYMPDLKAQELDLTSSDGAMHLPTVIELIAKHGSED